MKLSLPSLVFALIILAALPTAAQTPPPDIGDKTGGEMEQILQRELWFARTRGLDKLERPDLLRARAVESARAMRAAAADRDGLDWEPLGPDSMTMFDWDMGNVSGRVAALAVHPTDENTIYLGAASGGLWKTINGGASWTAIFDQVGTQTIGAIFIDPADPNTVWVGTGEQGQYCSSYFGLGLFKSTNGGQSWVPMNGTVGNPLDLSYVSTIAVHPSNSQLVLVGGHGYCNSGSYHGGGLFRSTDGGANWTKVLAGPVTDLLIFKGHSPCLGADTASASGTGARWKTGKHGGSFALRPADWLPKRNEQHAKEDHRPLLMCGCVPTKEGQAAISQEILEKEIARGFKTRGMYRKRLGCFVNGMAIGSEDFIRGQINRMREEGLYRRRKNPIPQLGGVQMSLREQRGTAVVF